ncbi:MAG: DUF4124 domain-containing protein [Rhodanobacter sp.]
MIRLGILLLLLIGGLPAAATTIYQCTGTNGQVTYQDKPCPGSQHEHVLQLPDTQPALAPTPAQSVDHPVDRSPPVAAIPMPLPPAAPLPIMYSCMRATDGKTYLSENGNPQPYLAPLGILGISSPSLSQTYSPANNFGQNKPTAGMVAGNYTWVQDQCRELSADETCHALRDAYDANELKLQRAFQSDQPPLLQRETTLRAQLTNC